MPRGRKPRLSRMHAAVDAMAQLGFPREIVISRVKKLLKEYGGDEGWPFIEDSAYLVLIDALIGDVEEDDRNQPEEIPLEDGVKDAHAQQDEGPKPAEVATSSGVAAKPTCSEVVSSSSGIHNEVGENGKSWKDIFPNGNTETVENEAAQIVFKINEDPKTAAEPRTVTSNPSPSPTTNTCQSSRLRRPCYGWIDSDEEDEGPNDFIYLTPAHENLDPKQSLIKLSKPASGGTEHRRKRKSRWDQKPGDP